MKKRHPVVCIDKSLREDERLFSALLTSYRANPGQLLVEGMNARAKSCLEEALRVGNVEPLWGAGRDAREQLFELALKRDRKWPNGSTLKVKFLNGSPELHRMVETFAVEWCKYANLFFIFDQEGEANIRVSFNPGEGNWSFIGLDCQGIEKDKPTMNLDVPTVITNLGLFGGTVIHEFGHAIGCIHEHQSPAAGIPWDKQAVYDYYKSSDNWSVADVDHNIFAKYDDANGITNSTYDRKSIMHYPIDAAHVTDRRFAVGWNTELSQQDKDFIRREYPGRVYTNPIPLFEQM